MNIYKEIEEIRKSIKCCDCIYYDDWVDYDNYGGLVNECKKEGYFCFVTTAAISCKYFKKRESI